MEHDRAGAWGDVLCTLLVICSPSWPVRVSTGLLGHTYSAMPDQTLQTRGRAIFPSLSCLHRASEIFLPLPHSTGITGRHHPPHIAFPANADKELGAASYGFSSSAIGSEPGWAQRRQLGRWDGPREQELGPQPLCPVASDSQAWGKQLPLPQAPPWHPASPQA